MVTKAMSYGSEHFFAGAMQCCRWAILPLAALLLLLVTGCQTSTTPQYAPITLTNSGLPTVSLLREGDIIRVTFPGAPTINPPPQQIRQDGNITLPQIGEVKATGKSTAELEKDLTDRYKLLIQNPTIIVTVESSSITLYVNGQVLHPGKVTTTHSITALEAVMEAGGPDWNKANLRKVKLTRQEGSSTQNYILDLQKNLDNPKSEPVYLKDGDIIVVPEKFQVFN